MKTPTAYEYDVRLPNGQPSRYNRDRIITVIKDFCKFIATLPFIQPGQLRFPPQGGWANINQESMAPLGKTDEVIQLLKSLPYFDVTGDQTPRSLRYAPRRAWCKVAPDTWLYNFQSKEYLTRLHNDGEAPGRDCVPPFIDLPPWVISLTTGHVSAGDYLLLDTSDGTITRYVLPGSSYDPTYLDQDSRHWRDECTDSTQTAEQCFQGLIAKWIRLDIVACPTQGHDCPAIVQYRDFLSPQEANELKNIYVDHGWPGEFRRDPCMQALIAWDEQHSL